MVYNTLKIGLREGIYMNSVENNIKIGDKLEIHCYKHNGKLHQLCNEGIVLAIDEEKIVVANNKAKLTERDGRSYHAKEPAILFFIYC